MGKTEKFVEMVKLEGITPKTIFDIGAFDCAETLELGEAFPDAEVFAFECVPKNIARCAERIASNPRLHLVPVAVDSCTRLMTFQESTSPNEECGSLLNPNGKYFEPMPSRKIIVPAFRIDDMVRHKEPNPPDVIWMDVQGCELRVLQGMEGCLDHLKMFWAEVAYSAFYEGQMLVNEFDQAVGRLGFEKIFEADGIPGWFGNACYKRMSIPQ